MPLESLVATIGALKGRIEQHQALLRQSEALTRYVLIDPLLRELGWDTEDPHKVRPEAGGLGGIADYELRQGDSTVALLEAKKLGQGVTRDGIGQALNYCNQRGIAYMIVSDGDKWEMYEVFRQAPIEDRLLAAFSISADAAYQCALKALYLWQPNLGSGKRVESPPEQTMVPMPAPQSPAVLAEPPAPTPVFSPPVPPSTDEWTGKRLAYPGQQPPVPPSTDEWTGKRLAYPGQQQPVPPSTDGWTSLVDLRPGIGKNAPSTIRLPDGEERQIKTWWHVLFEVAAWLSRTGRLTRDMCPVRREKSRYRHIVHTEARHSNGNEFVAPRQLPNGIFLEADYNANDSTGNARFLLTRCNQAPAEVLLKFD